MEGADTSALDEMSADCCGADNRLYLVKPIYPMPDGKARAGSGVAHAGCCAGGVTRDAYLHWMPMLNGAIGFITLDVTDDAP